MAAITLAAPLPEDLTAHVEVRGNRDGLAQEIECRADALKSLCGWMTQTIGYAFAGLVVEQDERWSLRYLFHSTASPSSWIHVLVHAPLEHTRFPSVSEMIHA